MKKIDTFATNIMLERHPDKEGGMPEPRVISPMADGIATKIGHILVSWGQMTEAMHRYTKCLIAYNESTPIRSKWLDYPQLSIRLKEEANKAFSGTKTPLILVEDSVKCANRAKAARKSFAHDAISWGVKNNAPILVVTSVSKKGRVSEHHYNLKRLESVLLDIGIAHGRINQLGLSCSVPPPYTSAEVSILQEIQVKGWTPHPILNTR
ncbi:hypothetical protein [Parvibaculum sp.]|uniref:hypothetical protein n=1 Tax=Parvibaculum sp. TaxID=2024848 RepID=UPI001B091611|nr:hypothetical protein [Parvibaculum sp.]MBO6668249.1 hypothetical protein [Parvibaculum sp.]MBO6690993.1 hypothetical protein [Parvibaculum sp.]MBO6714633.1 hypothetical protein [Parvibaculum sp.]